jgi:hypothetical protein
MDFHNETGVGQPAVQPALQSAPPPVVSDGRAPVDASAIAKDPTPEVPLPVPASPSQTGLISKAALADSEPASKLETSGLLAVQRTLKPYGINMLPELHDAPKLEAPSQN